MRTGPGLYILDEAGEPIELEGPLEGQVLTWGEWILDARRQVAVDAVGQRTVSTVFLAIDYSFGYGTAPLLYETAVFGDADVDICARYATRAEALAGHQAVVAELLELER